MGFVFVLAVSFSPLLTLVRLLLPQSCPPPPSFWPSPLCTSLFNVVIAVTIAASFRITLAGSRDDSVMTMVSALVAASQLCLPISCLMELVLVKFERELALVAVVGSVAWHKSPLPTRFRRQEQSTLGPFVVDVQLREVEGDKGT